MTNRAPCPVKGCSEFVYLDNREATRVHVRTHSFGSLLAALIRLLVQR